MPVKISYLKKTSPKSSGNLILFCKDRFKIDGLKKHLSKNDFSHISELLKGSNSKKDVLIFDITSKKKIILISVKEKSKSIDIENLGAKLFSKFNAKENSEYFLISNSISGQDDNFLSFFLHGIKLKSYIFNKYKTKKEKFTI